MLSLLNGDFANLRHVRRRVRGKGHDAADEVRRGSGGGTRAGRAPRLCWPWSHRANIVQATRRPCVACGWALTCGPVRAPAHVDTHPCTASRNTASVLHGGGTVMAMLLTLCVIATHVVQAEAPFFSMYVVVLGVTR